MTHVHAFTLDSPRLYFKLFVHRIIYKVLYTDMLSCLISRLAIYLNVRYSVTVWKLKLKQISMFKKPFGSNYRKNYIALNNNNNMIFNRTLKNVSR